MPLDPCPYRPHFAYRTPEGMVDERAEFPFDQRNVVENLAFGQIVSNQILRLDNDADFLWRELLWIFPDNYFYLAGQLGARIRDPWGNYLSSDFVPFLILGNGYYVLQPWVSFPPDGPVFSAPVTGGMGVPLVDEIFCPRSSVLQIDLLGLNQLGCANVGRFLARGVKRRASGECAPEFV